jgi:Ca2+-binding RTX toxin-like protein
VNTVNCTATDDSGNSSAGSFTITVQDTTAPILTIPANMTLEATGPAGRVVSFTASATDIVDTTPTVACIPASGSTFGLGTTLVNCTATDDSGNAANGSFTITVRDTTAPILTLPPNQTYEATGPAGAMVTFTATATDLVDTTPTVVCAPPSGSTLPVGSWSVTCTATDDSGNFSTGTFTITVRDTTPPVISLIGPAALTIPVGSTYSDEGATALDLVDGDLTASIVMVNPVNTGIAGIYVVTYNVTDSHGNAAIQVIRTVTVAHYCGGLEATMVGTAGDDTLTGTAGADVIVGLDGADTIYGLGGDDLVCGGPGNDMLYGGEGDDTIFANAGADYLYGEAGNDYLGGGAGNDKFTGEAGDDYMYAGSGIDLLDFSAAGAMILDMFGQTATGEGADTIIGFEQVIGSAFDDVIIGGPVANKIWAGTGNDTVSGGGGNDVIYGQEGDDTLNGNGGDDELWGGPGNDTLNGGTGTDILDGNGGSNTCIAGEILTNC